MKRRYSALLLFVLIGMLLCGCHPKTPEETEQGKAEGLTQLYAQLAGKNPLGISGYTWYDAPEAVNASGDVYLVAELSQLVKTEDLYLSYLRLYPKKDYLFWEAYASSDPPVYQAQADDGVKSWQIIGCVSYDGSKTACREFPVETRLICTDTGFTAVTPSEDGHIVHFIDSTMTDTGSTRIPDCTDFCQSQDGRRFYYISGSRLYAYDGDIRELRQGAAFRANYFYGVVTDAQGRDYLILGGMTGDVQYHTLIIDTEAGELVYIADYEDAFPGVSGNTYLETRLDVGNGSAWIIGREENCYECLWQPASGNADIRFAGEEQILLSSMEGNTVCLWLYDYPDDLRASAAFSVPLAEGFTPEFDGESSAYIMDIVPLPENEGYLLQIGSYTGEMQIYLWKPDTVAIPAQAVITPYELGKRPSLEVSQELDLSLFTPSALGEELRPLRERADRMEKQFGIRILIGEEAADMFGGYAITPLREYGVVSATLDCLQEELSRYPAGFFARMEACFGGPMNFYLAGTLIGVNEGNLATAGGFYLERANGQTIVLDCTDGGLHSGVHHELSHAIEAYLWTKGMQEDRVLFDDAAWNAMNPETDMYTGEYEAIIPDAYRQYIYGMLTEQGLSTEKAYFVDAYGMSYPTEDRARIFESSVNSWIYIDYDAAPHLREKRDYWFGCIRAAFAGLDFQGTVLE